MTVSAGRKTELKAAQWVTQKSYPALLVVDRFYIALYSPLSSRLTALACDSAVSVLCCFTSTETLRLIRDGEPRTATSIFTHLLSSAPKVPQCIHQSFKSSASVIFYRLVECCFTSTETVGLLRTGSPERPPRLSQSSASDILLVG